MTLREVMGPLKAAPRTGPDGLDREVAGGYSSDLLSDVLAHAAKGCVWITLQTHLNIVAVASMKELAGILITNGRSPDEETLRKAADEKVPIFVTSLSSFEAAGRLYSLVCAGNSP